MSAAPIPGSIDAHLHVWDLGVGDYPWLGPQHGVLYDTFTADQARAELDASGIESAVLVQAEDSVRETEWMLDLAAEHPWIVGVVGWMPLENPRLTAETLDRLRPDTASRLCGIRHLVHDDPRADFLLLPAVRESLALLAERGIPFDIPDAWPRHLGQAVDLATDLPSLTIVIDHFGKPPRGSADLSRWEATFRAAGELPNTVTKLSGLGVMGAPFTADALRDVWAIALDAFGPSRIMFGSNWPVALLDGGFRATVEVLTELITDLSPDARAEVLGGTARRVYRLPASSPTS